MFGVRKYIIYNLNGRLPICQRLGLNPPSSFCHKRQKIQINREANSLSSPVADL